MSKWREGRAIGDRLRYRWKSLALCGVLLLTGFIGISLALRTTGEEGPPPNLCDQWDQYWFHHRVTPVRIEHCLHTGLVDVNQVDEDARTLLHRIAHDFKETDDYYPSYPPSDVPDLYGYTHENQGTFFTGVDNHDDLPERISGNSRETRLVMVDILLAQPDIDLELTDYKHKTALHYAIRNGKAYPMAQRLIRAGAALTIDEDAREQWEERTLPLARTLRKRFKSPLDGSIDLDQLLQCQTADCALQEVMR